MRRLLLLLCVVFSACREAPDRFAAPDPFDSIPAGDAGRLTWNVREDQTPTWNSTSDSVYYSARSYPGFNATEGLLLSLPRATGRAKVLLEALQLDILPQPLLLAPAISRDRRSIAFVELTELNDTLQLCPLGISCPPLIDSSARNTLLVRGALRVRALDGSTAEARLPIEFAGRNGYNPIAHPFQRQFERSRSQIFRPSWSPDGTRLVFSNGLQLYVWTVGAASAAPIANTQDGVWPAWSPTGDVIAFTRLFREGSHTVNCACNISERGVEPMRIVIYHDRNGRVGTLVTIRPDGTGARELGEGEAPTWTPDGQFILAARDSEIVKMAPDGSNVTVIPQTQFGFEPAVSPDGRWLAFSRVPVRDVGDYDIWVVAF
jgi:Tol biopolymer transport system component